MAIKRRTYGYRRLYHLLKREGYEINHKRVYAIYKRNDLAKRKKKKRRYLYREKSSLERPSKPNEIWAMDFMTDSCGKGRKIRTLNIINLYAGECLKIANGRSLSPLKVISILDILALERSLPKRIIVDNGPEYTFKSFKKWSEKNNVHLE